MDVVVTEPQDKRLSVIDDLSAKFAESSWGKEFVLFVWIFKRSRQTDCNVSQWVTFKSCNTVNKSMQSDLYFQADVVLRQIVSSFQNEINICALIGLMPSYHTDETTRSSILHCRDSIKQSGVFIGNTELQTVNSWYGQVDRNGDTSLSKERRLRWLGHMFRIQKRSSNT